MPIIPDRYIPAYEAQQKLTLSKHVARLRRRKFGHDEFDFLVSESAVYSSRIEGVNIDPETYWRFRDSGIGQGSKSFQQVQDLRAAYEFARSHRLTMTNLLRVHRISSQNVVEEARYRGTVRTVPVGVYSGRTRIYLATAPEVIREELRGLFREVSRLLGQEMGLSETFYFASMLHLRFVQIHPFVDGNGRVARLLEKWFLAEKLGDAGWFVQSERFYHDHRPAYYRNLSMGETYETLNLDRSIPFLLMLPMSLTLR